MRLALDTLASVTSAAQTLPQLSIDLRHCDDFVESLVDCAEDQVDVLAGQTEEITDEIDITTYEDVVRACRSDNLALQRVAAFGDEDFELDHAADRLIAVTTILRNLSFLETNHAVLADEIVVKFLCVVIRYLGTREKFLRNPKNTLDFMKDIITLLSNIAGYVELPGREQAFCLLQFLLSFAPAPVPTLSAEKLVFTQFEPTAQPYLPHAVDSLAKLFARDEPNRTHYKTIFALDASASPAHELLTRTFALSISPIPSQMKERPTTLPPLVEARKPVIMQGLLAADIVAGLAPGYEAGVTRAWLSSADGFAQNLLRLVWTLCAQNEPPPQARVNPRAQVKEDTDALYIIACAISMMRKLAERARDPNDPASIPAAILPNKDTLLSILSMRSPKWLPILTQLSSFAGLDD